ncbi:hypothetical protein [Nocardia nova]
MTGSLRRTDETHIADYVEVFDELAEHTACGNSAQALIRQAIAAHR